MTADVFTLLRDDWIFGALAILAVLATFVVIAWLFYAGQDARITSTHGPDSSLWPDGQPDRLPTWTPLDRGVPHSRTTFRSEHKGIVVNMRNGGSQ